MDKSEIFLSKYERSFEKKRARFVYEQFILPYFDSSHVVLDIGAGIGFYSDIMKPRVRNIKCLDVNPDNINLLKKKDYEAILADASCVLPFPDNYFDIVVALEVIEHLKMPEKLISEVSRVLKKKGNILISTPNHYSIEGFYGKVCEFLRGRKWSAWDPSHEHIFSVREFKNLVTQKFQIIKISGYYLFPKTTLTPSCLTFFSSSNNLLVNFCFIVNIFAQVKKGNT